VIIQELTRQAQGAHRIVGGVTASGVGQQGVAALGQGVEQVGLVRVLAQVHPANRHGDDFGARSVQRFGGLGKVTVFAGANQQARTIFAAGDDKRILHGASFVMQFSTQNSGR
jgi:hypothetical protein